jgi:hypothetical protein
MRGMQASPEAAQYETLGREDDALLVKMLAAGLPKLPAGQCAQYTCWWPWNRNCELQLLLLSLAVGALMQAIEGLAWNLPSAVSS